MNPLIRAFVAIDPGGEVRRAVGELQQDLRGAGVHATWVAPEACHLTLRFLGDVAPDLVAPIAKACREAASGLRVFDLQFMGAGAFPNLRRPRVLWLGVGGGSAALMDLHKAIEGALDATGFTPDRTFSPHLTIGRLKRLPGPEVLRTLSARLDALRARHFGRAHVSHALLLRSELLPSGPRYTALSEFPLGSRHQAD
ncbi:MAG: RNA 2',3'-cyclic phosphodiesterase [Chloroflexi bacterium]|nr:RNA 2',3'-cyclic phosphodiesterase [Chloroflexota bacterium]